MCAAGTEYESVFVSYKLSLHSLCFQYPFTTLIPNLGVWIPPEKDFRDPSSASKDQTARRQTDGAGSEGLALCVSLREMNIGLGLNFWISQIDFMASSLSPS